jgi:hypothetical protein
MSTDDISKKRVIYRLPGMDAVTIHRDVEYRATGSGDHTMDLYYPPGLTDGVPAPAVVFVSGYPDRGVQKILGCKLKEMASYVSWGQLAARSGLVAIAYTTNEPATDIRAVLDYVRWNAESLGIDESRIGVWACSGNVPNALSVLMREGGDAIRCAVLYYGYMLDLDGSTSVADMSRQVGFVDPCAGRSIDDLPRELPLFVVRAGRDQFPHLNETIDRFVSAALARNLPITLVNHPTAPHAFDLFDDGETSHEIVRLTLAFMRFRLLE